jgi:RNA 3'-terminal phosphate cyclase (ATP)
MDLEIDGSHGEGGGQILRGAVALSALTRRSTRIFNIRAGRPNPGLQPQHIVSLEAAATVTGATVNGLTVGSTEVEFTPRAVGNGIFRFDVGTAGSITLIIQTILPILALGSGPSEITISGGTDVPWSPPIDYFGQVVLPALRPFGIDATLSLGRRGHYPKGGGEATIGVRNVSGLKAVKAVERGQVGAIRGISHSTNLPEHVAKRQADSALRRLRDEGFGNVRISEDVTKATDLGVGSGLVLWAETCGPLRIGSDSLGARGKRAEEVGMDAAEALLAELRTGMAIDRHLGDMAIIYMAIAHETSEVGISFLTRHAETMMWLSGAFLGVGWQVRAVQGGGSVLKVTGAGLKSSQAG